MLGFKWRSVIVIALSLALLVTGCMLFNPGGDDVVHRTSAEIRDDYVGEGVFVKEVPFVFERVEYYELGEDAAEVEDVEIIWDEKVRFISDELAEKIIRAEAEMVEERVVLEVEESIDVYEQNDILVHVEKQVTYKVESREQKPAAFEYILILADIEEVIEDIDIPEQTVELNDDNVADIPEDVELNIVSNFRHEFVFDDKKYFDDQITVDGSVTLIGPSVDFHYRLGTRGDRGNFDIAFTASEEFELEITGELQVDRSAEIRIATYGLDIGRFGQCSVDLYLVLDVKGNISFYYTIDQGVSIRTGVRGEKGRVFPRWGTVEFYFTPESYFDVEGQVDGQLTVKAGAKAGFNLRLIGRDIVALEALFAIRAKAELEVQLTEPYDRCLTLEIEALLAANATLIDRHFQIYSNAWLIYEYASPGCNGVEEDEGELDTGEQALTPGETEDPPDDPDAGPQDPAPGVTTGYTLNVNASRLGAQPTLLWASIASNTGHGGTTSYTIPSIDSGVQVHLEAPLYIDSGPDQLRFERWSGDVESTNRAITFSMNNDKKVTAHYISDSEEVLEPDDPEPDEPDEPTLKYNLTVTSSADDPPNKVGVDIKSNTGHGGRTPYTIKDIEAGTQVHLEAPADTDLVSNFNGWSGDISDKNRSITFIMDADKKITANYWLQIF